MLNFIFLSSWQLYLCHTQNKRGVMEKKIIYYLDSSYLSRQSSYQSLLLKKILQNFLSERVLARTPEIESPDLPTDFHKIVENKTYQYPSVLNSYTPNPMQSLIRGLIKKSLQYQHCAIFILNRMSSSGIVFTYFNISDNPIWSLFIRLLLSIFHYLILILRQLVFCFYIPK